MLAKVGVCVVRERAIVIINILGAHHFNLCPC
jgi:hypothetical protein